MGHRRTRPHATLKACRIRWYAVALAGLTWLAGEGSALRIANLRSQIAG